VGIGGTTGRIREKQKPKVREKENGWGGWTGSEVVGTPSMNLPWRQKGGENEGDRPREREWWVWGDDKNPNQKGQKLSLRPGGGKVPTIRKSGNFTV